MKNKFTIQRDERIINNAIGIISWCKIVFALLIGIGIGIAARTFFTEATPVINTATAATTPIAQTSGFHQAIDAATTSIAQTPEFHQAIDGAVQKAMQPFMDIITNRTTTTTATTKDSNFIEFESEIEPIRTIGFLAPTTYDDRFFMNTVTFTPDNTVAFTPDNTVAFTPDNTVAFTPDNTFAFTPDNTFAFSPDSTVAFESETGGMGFVDCKNLSAATTDDYHFMYPLETDLAFFDNGSSDETVSTLTFSGTYHNTTPCDSNPPQLVSFFNTNLNLGKEA